MARSFLIVRLGALGDLVHALPAAAALRAAWPDARIDWLVDARHSAILDLVPVVDRRVVISPARPMRADRPGHPGDRQFPGRAGVLSAIRWLRQQQYDAAVDLQGLIKSAVFARASGARRVIGFDRAHLREPQARAFYTETVVPRAGTHVVAKNLAALAALGVEVPAVPRFPIDIPFSPAHEAIRATVAGRGSARGFALVNPGGAWPNKRWPTARFGAVAAALARDRGLVPVVTSGPGEDALAREIVAASGGAAIAAPPTAVGDLLAIASRAALALSGDTGPLHLAAAVGTPLVALFGPTDPARNGPWSPDDISLSRFADCVCHYQRRCRRDRACIEEITVEDVLGAIERRLAIAGRAQA
jgi:lipopolysaccharide heptosyltransferase I